MGNKIFCKIIITFLLNKLTHSNSDGNHYIEQKYIFELHPNYTDRNNEIVDLFRENLAVDIFKTSLGGWLQENSAEKSFVFPESIADSVGNKYQCFMSNHDSSAASQDMLADSLRLLDGMCAQLNKGWWHYQWCHRKHVNQFHIDSITGVLDPLWTLGVFEYSTKDTENFITELFATTPSAGIVDYFTNGQWCDETSAPRSVRVIYSCCWGEKPKKGVAKKKVADKEISAQFVSIEESELCSYVAKICSPSFCAYVEGSSNKLSVKDLLSGLQGTCLQKHEGWWSYEFCFMTTIRQFHMEILQQVTSEGASHVANVQVYLN